jgi:hypothetical protein
MELQELLKKLCRELPENYEITISAEKGAACVLISDSHGTPRESLLEEVTIEEQCLDLLCLANEEEGRHSGDIG